MPWTRRQIVTAVSAIYLLIPLAIAAYCLHTIRAHNLPIPTVLGAFTLALPFIAGVSLESIQSLQRRQKSPRPLSYSNYPLTLLLLVIYETALAALSGTYLHPQSALTCALDERWRALFTSKNEKAVRRIQDAFDCCGLHSLVDKAWPFEGNGVKGNTCKKRFDRTRACLEPWRGEEQRIAGLLLAVAILVFVWKALIVFWPERTQSTWFDMFSGRRGNGEQRGRRQLGYHAIGDTGRYLDEPTPAEGVVATAGHDNEPSPANEAAPHAGQNEEHERWAA